MPGLSLETKEIERRVEQIFLEYARGNHSLEQAVEELFPLVYEHVLIVLKFAPGEAHADELDELFQQAMIRVFHYLPNYDRERRFLPWMDQIARNVKWDWLAGYRREVTLFADSANGAEGKQGHPGTEAAIDIARLLQKLSKAKRELLVRKYILGYTDPELAIQYGCSLSNIKSRVRTAVKKLADFVRIGRNPGPPDGPDSTGPSGDAVETGSKHKSASVDSGPQLGDVTEAGDSFSERRVYDMGRIEDEIEDLLRRMGESERKSISEERKARALANLRDALQGASEDKPGMGKSASGGESGSASLFMTGLVALSGRIFVGACEFAKGVFIGHAVKAAVVIGLMAPVPYLIRQLYFQESQTDYKREVIHGGRSEWDPGEHREHSAPSNAAKKNASDPSGSERFDLVAFAAPAQNTQLAAAYQELNSRVFADQTSFYVYLDQDSALNHGFPSGWFGSMPDLNDYITLNSGCIDDPTATTGCSADTTKLDRNRGTVLSITFAPLSTGQYAGVNIEEPENWGVNQTGNGYDLSGSTALVFDARSPDSAQVQFGMGKCTTAFMTLSPFWQTITVPLRSLSCTMVPSLDISDVNILFGVATNVDHAPNGATVLLDNIRYEPVPASRSAALSFPLGNQTFGVVPAFDFLTGRVAVPPDQVLRNLTTIYESALTEFSLLVRGQTQDLQGAELIANTFDYALHHDSHGDPLPTGINATAGAHNGYEGGDIGLYNDQVPPKQGKAGDIRLSGFSIGSNACGSSHFCLVLDGATGGNNAFVIMALLDAYERWQDAQYLADARFIGNWIISNLADTSGTGFGGYYVGYPDDGAAKILETGKSTENNADIFAAFTRLATVASQLGQTDEANSWQTAANAAGDFVMQMYDAANGRFNTGTVPVGTAPSTGICPSGATRGADAINTCDFLDADTFTTLALAWSPRYRNQIDWHVPVQYGWDHFFESVTASGQTYQGFDIVSQPTAGPNGVAWEFTGQMCEAMEFLDSLYGNLQYQTQISQCLSWLAQAQASAPFGDGQGLVASTMQDGDTLTPYEQCVSTPYQCIAERVGLAATNWSILAEDSINPFMPPFAPVAGALKQISTGADGTTWGLNASGQIYSYDAQAQNWTNIPGSLSQVAAGSANAVWGVNEAGETYRWDTNAQTWAWIPGDLSEIAVGADGDVWGINSQEQIYRFNAQGQSWASIPGSLKQIAVGFDGAVWGVNDADAIYRFNPGTQVFAEVSGSLKQVSIGADGDVWGVNASDQVYHFNRLTQDWDESAGNLMQISVGAGNNVWGLEASGQVYEYAPQSQSFTALATPPLAQISAGASGAAWGVDSSNNIYQLLGSAQAVNVLHQAPGTLAQIATGTDGSVWGVNSAGQIYTFEPVAQTWTYVPGELNQIALGTGESVWGLNASGQIYHWDATNQSWSWIPGSLSQIAVGANGDVWGINSAQEIYRFDAATQGWTSIPGSLRQISVGADGAVWGINFANEIYQFVTSMQSWVQRPGTLAQISVGSGTNVWGINPEGSAYRFDSASESWVFVPGVTLTQIEAAFDGAVWGLDASGHVWWLNGQSWTQIPGSLSQISVAADAVVWGLDANGSIYFYR